MLVIVSCHSHHHHHNYDRHSAQNSTIHICTCVQVRDTVFSDKCGNGQRRCNCSTAFKGYSVPHSNAFQCGRSPRQTSPQMQLKFYHRHLNHLDFSLLTQSNGRWETSRASSLPTSATSIAVTRFGTITPHVRQYQPYHVASWHGVACSARPLRQFDEETSVRRWSCRW